MDVGRAVGELGLMRAEIGAGTGCIRRSEGEAAAVHQAMGREHRIARVRRGRRRVRCRLSLDAVSAVRSLREDGLLHELVSVRITQVRVARRGRSLGVVVRRRRHGHVAARGPGVKAVDSRSIGAATRADAAATTAVAVEAGAAGGGGDVRVARVGRAVGGSARGAGPATTAAVSDLCLAVARGALDAAGDGPVLECPFGGALGFSREVVEVGGDSSSVLAGLFALTLDETL